MIKLLSAILHNTGPLRDAVCRHRGELFDDHSAETAQARTERLSAALELCKRCPARLACSTLVPPPIGRGAVAVQAGRVLAGPALHHPAA
ncbi:MAG: hypothetical protein ACRDUW_18240 [Pseudonocardiaceae bacterium]